MRQIVSNLVLFMGACLVAFSASAQPVSDVEEKLAFDRPEAWALKYFASVTLLSTVAAPEDRPAGAIDASLELAPVPRLDRSQRTVGFNGRKEEDLNRLPALVRPRLTLWLPDHCSITAAWVPPVGLNGVRANVVSLAVAKSMVRERSSGAATLYGQTGTVKGDFTCPSDFQRFDPEGVFGCERASSDSTMLRYAGFELFGGHRINRFGSPILHVSGAVNYMDLAFQVNALTFGFIDRRHETTHGWTWSASTGASWNLMRGADVGVEVFYTPISVRRLNEGQTNDPLLTARILMRYRMR